MEKAMNIICKTVWRAGLFLLAGLLLLGTGLAAAQGHTAKRPWRLALVTGGPFSEYQLVLQGIARELDRQGLIEHGNVPMPSGSASLASMWAWLGANAGGDKLIFAQDALYCADWNEDSHYANIDALEKRLRDQRDIDLVLALGTWAGEDLIRDGIDVPIVLAAAANPVEAGIVLSPEDSGHDNLFAVVDNMRTTRQVTMFHSIFNFKKLGVMYEDDASGRSSVAMGQIESTARKLGVELALCAINPDLPRAEDVFQAQLLCHERLVEQKADAVYITFSRGMIPEKIPQALKPLIEAHIPTFSQLGSVEVERGVLLGMSKNISIEEGHFAGAAVVAIMEGKKPRDLRQIFEGATTLAVNLRTTTLLGWNPPLEVLAIVDEFFQTM